MRDLIKITSYEGFSYLKSKIYEKFTYSEIQMVFAMMSSKTT